MTHKRSNPFDKFLSIEDIEHVKVVNFLKEIYPNVIAFHVPNEGKKTAFQAYKTSIMGILKGCPDFIVLHPKHQPVTKEDAQGRAYLELQHYGLLIELKAPSHNRTVKNGKNAGKIVKSEGKLSSHQKELITRLNKIKYKAVCCFGANEAIKELDEYLKPLKDAASF